MNEIGLEEWRMAEAMADLTRSYLESVEGLGKCAEDQSAFEST